MNVPATAPEFAKKLRKLGQIINSWRQYTYSEVADSALLLEFKVGLTCISVTVIMEPLLAVVVSTEVKELRAVVVIKPLSLVVVIKTVLCRVTLIGN